MMSWASMSASAPSQRLEVQAGRVAAKCNLGFHEMPYAADEATGISLTILGVVGNISNGNTARLLCLLQWPWGC